MSTPNSVWQTETKATSYLEGIRGAMPAADLQFQVVDRIVRGWCINPKRILDLGCGNGILGRFLLEIYPSAHVVFVDFSEPMLKAAHKNLDGLGEVTIVKSDFGTPDWVDVLTPVEPMDIVISGFAIHHQPDRRKKELFSEIHEMLSPGGIFLNLEHVSSFSPEIERLFDQLFIDHLHTFRSKSDPDIDRKQIAHDYHSRTDKKENLLASVDAQCGWLREIGFIDVDCYLKVFELALFGGRKASDLR